MRPTTNDLRGDLEDVIEELDDTGSAADVRSALRAEESSAREAYRSGAARGIASVAGNNETVQFNTSSEGIATSRDSALGWRMLIDLLDQLVEDGTITLATAVPACKTAMLAKLRPATEVESDFSLLRCV